MILGKRSKLAKAIKQNNLDNSDLSFICSFSSNSFLTNIKRFSSVDKRETHKVIFQTQLTLQNNSIVNPNSFNFGLKPILFSPYILLKLLDEAIAIMLFKEKLTFIYLPKILYKNESFDHENVDYIRIDELMNSLKKIDLTKRRYYFSSKFNPSYQPKKLNSSVRVSSKTVLSFFASLALLFLKIFSTKQNIADFDDSKFKTSFMFKNVLTKVRFTEK